MEGNARLAAYQRAGVSICRVDGVLHAWVPGWDPLVGREAHADTADELADKLAGMDDPA